jgi:Protein of unknown function (DUF2510)
MRIEDAPRAGWYPDPEGGSRLRWWEGTDWSDRWRAPPTSGAIEVQARAVEQARRDLGDVVGGVSLGSITRQDSDAIVNQVRQAARAEAERAAGLFRQEAKTAIRDFTPLISEYTNKAIRWVRVAAVLIVIVLVGWLLFQIVAQASLFDWIGDRIDNISDNVGDDTGAIVASLRT